MGCGIVGTFIAWMLKNSGVHVQAFSLRRKYPSIGLIQSLMQKYEEDIIMAKLSRDIYHKVSKEYNLTNAISIVKSYTIVRKDREKYVDELCKKWIDVGANVKKLTSLDDVPFRVYDDEIVYRCDNDYIINIDIMIDKIWKDIKIKKGIATIKRSGDNVKVIVNNCEISERFDYIVISCGAWSRKILENAEFKLPLISYKCQAGLFLIDTKSSEYILYDYVNRMYVRPGGYLSKIRLGKLRFMVCGNGNTPPQEPEENPKVEYWFSREIIDKLKKRYNTVLYVKGSAGYCDTTPDGKPLIAILKNVIVVSGFDGYGAEIGPGIAKCIADFIIRGRLEKMCERYLAGRFNRLEHSQKLPEIEAHEL